VKQHLEGVQDSENFGLYPRDRPPFTKRTENKATACGEHHSETARQYRPKPWLTSPGDSGFVRRSRIVEDFDGFTDCIRNLFRFALRPGLMRVSGGIAESEGAKIVVTASFGYSTVIMVPMVGTATFRKWIVRRVARAAIHRQGSAMAKHITRKKWSMRSSRRYHGLAANVSSGLKS
jgi:hypothetical protein